MVLFASGATHALESVVGRLRDGPRGAQHERAEQGHAKTDNALRDFIFDYLPHADSTT